METQKSYRNNPDTIMEIAFFQRMVSDVSLAEDYDLFEIEDIRKAAKACHDILFVQGTWPTPEQVATFGPVTRAIYEHGIGASPEFIAEQYAIWKTDKLVFKALENMVKMYQMGDNSEDIVSAMRHFVKFRKMKEQKFKEWKNERAADIIDNIWDFKLK